MMQHQLRVFRLVELRFARSTSSGVPTEFWITEAAHMRFSDCKHLQCQDQQQLCFYGLTQYRRLGSHHQSFDQAKSHICQHLGTNQQIFPVDEQFFQFRHMLQLNSQQLFSVLEVLLGYIITRIQVLQQWQLLLRGRRQMISLLFLLC